MDWAFRTAAPHTRLVRFLRCAVPVGIVAIGLLIVVATSLNPFHQIMAAFPIDPRKISLVGARITMELPRVDGFTTDSRPYQLTARAATQDITEPDILELRELEAQVDLKDQQPMTIKSIKEVYDTRREVLKLIDQIVVNSTSATRGICRRQRLMLRPEMSRPKARLR